MSVLFCAMAAAIVLQAAALAFVAVVSVRALCAPEEASGLSDANGGVVQQDPDEDTEDGPDPTIGFRV